MSGLIAYGCLSLLCLVVSVAVAQRYVSSAVVRYLLLIVVFLCALISVMTWTIYQAHIRLSDVLSPDYENVVTRVTFRVMAMSQDQNDQQKFTVQRIDPDTPGIPVNMMVIWPQGPLSKNNVLPGQVWRAALVLKRVHSASNPAGFDYEAFMFQKNIRAMGKVRGVPKLISDDPYSALSVMVARSRHNIRQAMRKSLGDARYAPVMIALAIGDQDSVESSDWEIFNKTGITHLVSISGSHVTMLAAFGGLSMLWLWRRIRLGSIQVCEKIPSSEIASYAALIIALIYCLLAGWGVPARRTFFMLLAIGIAKRMRMIISPVGILSLAAIFVTLLDPWSPLATGFWLSFGAVLVLFSVSTQALKQISQQSGIKKWFSVLKESFRLQWLITLAMTPVLAFLFHQVPLVSMFANALAIPVMTFVVTPLALLTALIALLPGFERLAEYFGWLGNFSMSCLMWPVTWLSEARWSMWNISAMPIWLLGLAIVGVLWSLLPPGIPHRWTGWCLLFPALVWRADRPDQGEWTLLALDVGQGSAVLVATAGHHLLFDTGPRMTHTDAGQRVILPALRALSIDKLDALVVSHADTDHAGGLVSLAKSINLHKIYTSFDLPLWLKRTSPAFRLSNSTLSERCKKGLHWEWDGVIFTFLHPQGSSHPPGKKNADSCVLHVSGKYHSALLSGDIGIHEETILHDLLKSFRTDVVIVPHHGSSTSSSETFIRALGASHAIIQAGFLNRFKHPDPSVIQRWEHANTQVWRTDRDGALRVNSTGEQLRLEAYRQKFRRYWHHLN